MARTRPQYKGGQKYAPHPVNNELELKDKLYFYYQNENKNTISDDYTKDTNSCITPEESFEEAFGLASEGCLFNDIDGENFVKNVMIEVQGSANRLYSLSCEIKNGEAKVECEDLLKIGRKIDSCLNEWLDKWARMSPGVERYLPCDIEPWDYVDKLAQCSEVVASLIPFLESTSKKIKELPQSPKTTTIDHCVALDMAINVLRILREYGLPIRNYVSDGLNEHSIDINVLLTIGRHIRLSFTPQTWRDIILEAKKQAPDLI